VSSPGTARWLLGAADLFLGTRCRGCGGLGIEVCPSCRATLLLAGPVPLPPDLGAPGWAGAPYGGLVATLVVEHKERGARGAAHPLADLLTLAVLAGIGEVRDDIVLVPVPSTRHARRRRGADPLRRVVHRTADRLATAGVSATVVPALRHTRPVEDQGGLTRARRVTNLDGALQLVPRLAASVVTARRVVVVDDVATTGATLREAVRAIAARGRVQTATVAVASGRSTAVVGPAPA
jgi:predicted amidophosphoribosyltransferase